MNDQLVYLRQNVVPEPLFDSWYAWSHLISPATAAMNVYDRHLKIMNSYIQAPHIHAAAVKNPKMLGGPFMDYPVNRVEDVRKLKDNTMTTLKPLLDFAEAIRELNRMLMTEAKGFSMDPLYEKIPSILRGYVELLYDTNNNPGFRFFESLLYQSPYYVEESQSISFYLIENDNRAFVLSTPRIESENVLNMNIPFKSAAIDELFRAQRIPASYRRLRDLFELTPKQEKIFETFFTAEAPEAYNRYTGEGARTRYFGHACLLVETKNISILVDPVISYGYEADISRYTYKDLPDEIDYILITHNHQDHILFETMLQLRHKVKNIIVPRNGGGRLQDPNLKLMFTKLGFKNVIEMDELDCIKSENCSITGLPFIGEHSDLDVRTKLCYHVDLGHLKIVFAADSCNVEPKLYEHVHKIIGDIDVLFLGMECDGAPLSWLYGPLMTEPLAREKDHSRRLAGSNYERGIDMVNRFHPKEVYVYAMGQEPWLNYIMAIKYTEESNPIIASTKMIKECEAQNIVAERLFGEKEIIYINNDAVVLA
jgi:L-ascorbate metabolism protein UlaG (beta-lactamase superfamily)